MRLRAAIACLAALAAMALGGQSAAAVSPSPCPTPNAASGSRTCVNPNTDPYQVLAQRLGGDLATALTTQQKLSQALNNATATELSLSTEVTLEEARVLELQNEITQLNQQIGTLQARIQEEQQQLATLARAMYERPATVLDLIASSTSLSDLLSRATTMVIAGQRVHSLEDSLKVDLAQVQADLDARQSDLDQENATLEQERSDLAQISGVQTELDSLSVQLVSLIGQIRTTTANLNNVAPDVTAQLAALLETEELNLAQQEEAAAWAQASVGSGEQSNANMLPSGVGPSAGGIAMVWPMRGGVITQPFGPTNFVLEPPLGPYPHFHTGVDIAAPLGTPVDSAAAGVVVVVAHTAVGYGNYVIVAHGYGLMTLYGHLLETDVYPGEVVRQGQVIGKEGATGWATGPHVHFEVRINGQFVDPMRFLPPI
jgi:murein DD-endopeptidase MepM/ murein hydrolase activator NlpD